MIKEAFPKEAFSFYINIRKNEKIYKSGWWYGKKTAKMV